VDRIDIRSKSFFKGWFPQRYSPFQNSKNDRNNHRSYSWTRLGPNAVGECHDGRRKQTLPPRDGTKERLLACTSSRTTRELTS
jgi:hypothetical protein